MPTPHDPLPLPTVRRRPGRRALTLGVVGVGVVGILAINAVAGASDAGGYRTATVKRASVDQSLHDTGTVEPVSQVSVAFPVSGTVATVAVTVGTAVTTGQALATLDGAALQRQIDTAQATLDQAELTLQQARDGEISGGVGSSTTGGDGSARNVSFDGGGAATSLLLASATRSVDDGVTDAQDAVLHWQQEVDARLLAAQDALDSAQRICAAVGDPDAATPTSTTSSPSSSSTTVDPSASIGACRTALTDVLTAQQATSDAQAALADAARTLDGLRAEQAATEAGGGPTAGTDGNATDGNATAGGTDGAAAQPDGSSASDGSSSPSSADLIADQRAVDGAEADLAVARQALEQATIVSPIDGTVTAVDLAAGDSVTAGSTTSRILVEGPGGYEVTATLAVDQLPKVKLGQSATVVPDGSDEELTGEVVSIGLAATSSSSGATTYPVTVALDDDAGLRNGSVASVSIVTDAADRALVVPTSAVRASGGAHSVIVLDGGRTKATDVEVGAVGATLTEITSGLRAGQRVVLADLAEPLPSSATSSSNGSNGGNGNVPVLKFGGNGGGATRFGRPRG
jgi:multidrug efflux pump subunit AcrA (membrane-fusion protein)